MDVKTLLRQEFPYAYMITLDSVWLETSDEIDVLFWGSPAVFKYELVSI